MRFAVHVSTGALAFALGAAPAMAAFPGYIGDIMAVGFDYCPLGWTDADGASESFGGNPSLFNLIGTTYGGSGNVFSLPDLRARTPLHLGTGPGLPPAQLGEPIGEPSVQLTAAQMPSHSHALNATTVQVSTTNPQGAVLGDSHGASSTYASMRTNYVPMSAAAVSTVGASAPVDLHQPSLVLHYCIAAEADYPPK